MSTHLYSCGFCYQPTPDACGHFHHPSLGMVWAGYCRNCFLLHRQERAAQGDSPTYWQHVNRHERAGCGGCTGDWEPRFGTPDPLPDHVQSFIKSHLTESVIPQRYRT